MKKKIFILLSLLMLACGKEKEIQVEKPKEVVAETVYQEKEIEELKLEKFSTNSSDLKIDMVMSEDIETKDLKPYVKISPSVDYKVLKMDNHIIIVGKFDIKKEYEVELLKGLKGEKTSLNKNIKEKIKFNEMEPQIKFSNEGIILPRLNESKIAFRSINVKDVNLKIKKIYPNNITQFLQDFTFKGNGNIFDYTVEENLYKVGDTVFENNYKLNYEKNIWAQNEIDLKNVSKEKGIYIVELSFDEDGIDYVFPDNVKPWKKRQYFRTEGKIGRAIIISDMGMVAQKDVDNNMVVTVLDVTGNKPIEDVKLQAISVNNQIIDEKISDENGEVRFQNGEKIFYILAQQGEEFSILKLSDSKFSYDGFLVDGEFVNNGMRAFLYSDRGVYRPGDTINIGVIARDHKGEYPDGQPITIDVFSPRGDKYIDGEIVKNGIDGFFTYSFETSKEAQTGIWEVNVYVGGEKKNKFNLKLPIETVVPYKIKVESKFSKDSKDEVIKGEIEGKYLFGAPAENLKYMSKLTIQQKDIEFERYKNFIFSNPTTYFTDIILQEKGNLNYEGKGKIKFDLIGEVPKNINLVGNIVTRVIEPSGRPVMDVNTIKINDFETYIGIEKPNSSYIKSGDKINLQVMALSKDGEHLVSGKKLRYKVYKNEYSWWWDYYDYGSYIKSIKTDKNTVLLYEKEFETTSDPYIIDYEIKGNGEIFVEVEDMETHQSTGVNFYASIWENPNISKKIDKLKIETDKKEYNIGDKATIKFEGTKDSRALITIEKSGRILKRYWKDIDELTNSVEVDIDEKLFPNAYVSVALFQNYENQNNDRALRLYGAVPIMVRDTSKELNIDIKSPDQLKPNEKFTIDIEADGKMEYTVSVVDEGLLQLVNFQTPNPFGYFYGKEGLQVSTYDNYSEIIDKTFGSVHQVLTPGGDMYLMSSAPKSNGINNFGFNLSERFKPLAIYRGVLVTDEDGRGSIDIELPNYTGAVRVMVTGASKDKYGMSEKTIEVRSPIIADISMPRMLKVGDEFKIPVKVFATEDNLGDIEIELEFLGKKSTETLTLKNDENKNLVFDVKVGNEIGNKKAILRIKSPKYSNEEIIDIDVTSNNGYTYINRLDYIEDRGFYKFPIEAIKGSVNSKIVVSSAPILALNNRLEELIRYPYGCLEQTVSVVFPQLFIDTLASDSKELKKDSIKNVNRAISKLSSFQLDDGSFSYWPGNEEANLWVTNYVGHFMVVAKEKGFYVPEDLYNNWLEYAVNMSRRSDCDINTKAYTLYILALADKGQISEMNYIYDNELKNLEITSRWYLATAYSLIGEDEIAREIAKDTPREVEKRSFDYYVDSFGSKLRDEAIILNSYYTIYNKVDSNLYKNILSELQSENWLSTQSMGYSLLAIGQIKNSTDTKEVDGDIIVDGKKIKFKTQNGVWEYSNSDMKEVAVVSKDVFVNQYWEGIPINYEQPNESKNISVERKFYDELGKEIDVKYLRKGKAFYMELKVLPNAEGNSYFYLQNVALTQIIPSGWEIENTRLLNIQMPQWIESRMEDNNLEYEDIRDNRVNFFFDLTNYSREGQRFFIKLNCVTEGKYKLPGTKVEAMYNNECRAYLNGFDVEVR